MCVYLRVCVPACVCACADRRPAGSGDVPPGLGAGRGNGQSAVPVAGKGCSRGSRRTRPSYSTYRGDRSTRIGDGVALTGSSSEEQRATEKPGLNLATRGQWRVEEAQAEEIPERMERGMGMIRKEGSGGLAPKDKKQAAKAQGDASPDKRGAA